MIVVIGSNGFIGRHLTVEAVRREIPLTLVSTTFDHRFLATFAQGASAVTAAEFASRDHDHILAAADAIVYLAGRSVPSSSMEQPALELTDNVEPAFTFFLRVSAINPAALLVYVSSGGTVYGRTDVARISETHPLQPVSAYGLGKRLCEDCLRFCGEAYGQRFAILRVSNPVGRWHSDVRQGLLTAVLRAIRTGAPLQVFGDGTSVRDYLDADDLADAILRVARSGVRDRTWNVGSGEGHSVLDVVDLVGDAVGKKPEIRFAPPRSVDVTRCVLSIERIRQDLGWAPTMPLAQSIDKIVQETSVTGAGARKARAQ